MRKATTSLPRLRAFRSPVTTPASTRSTTESVNISVWMPRSFLSVRSWAAAAGIAPIPSWSVAPSGMRSAMYAAIRRSMSPITGRGDSYGGWSHSIARSIWLTWMNDSPSVRGMDGLNWTMTVLAASTAACMASTDVPSEQNPWRSGGVTLANTASSGSSPDRKTAGTSERKIGTKSARPSLTALRALGPMNSARCRKWGAISGARWGPGPSVWRWTIETSDSSGARATRASSRTDGVAAAHWR